MAKIVERKAPPPTRKEPKKNPEYKQGQIKVGPNANFPTRKFDKKEHTIPLPGDLFQGRKLEDYQGWIFPPKVEGGLGGLPVIETRPPDVTINYRVVRGQGNRRS